MSDLGRGFVVLGGCLGRRKWGMLGLCCAFVGPLLKHGMEVSSALSMLRQMFKREMCQDEGEIFKWRPFTSAGQLDKLLANVFFC